MEPRGVGIAGALHGTAQIAIIEAVKGHLAVDLVVLHRQNMVGITFTTRK
jgi:hypothetical protein